MLAKIHGRKSIERQGLPNTYDGKYQISNIGAENGLRGLAVGRKNYMFCGSHQAANHAAIIYSLLGTCRLLGANPEARITDVLNRLPDT